MSFRKQTLDSLDSIESGCNELRQLDIMCDENKQRRKQQSVRLGTEINTSEKQHWLSFRLCSGFWSQGRQDRSINSPPTAREPWHTSTKPVRLHCRVNETFIMKDNSVKLLLYSPIYSQRKRFMYSLTTSSANLALSSLSSGIGRENSRRTCIPWPASSP